MRGKKQVLFMKALHIYIYMASNIIFLGLYMANIPIRINKFVWNGHLPVSTASASLVFQCFAMFSESGSSGFGALRRAWMLIHEVNQFGETGTTPLKCHQIVIRLSGIMLGTHYKLPHELLHTHIRYWPHTLCDYEVIHAVLYGVPNFILNLNLLAVRSSESGLCYV